MNQQNQPPTYSTAGMIARWQPVHLGHTAVLQALCTQAGNVKIGIGSANVQNARSPFTLDEVTDMLDLTLAGYDNYTLIPLPDLNDGPRWREMVTEKFGPLEVFFTANPYVRSLLKENFDIQHPVEIVPVGSRIPMTGSEVRLAIARGEPYHHYLPPSILKYLEDNNLITRFRQEYGLETLAIQNQIIS